MSLPHLHVTSTGLVLAIAAGITLAPRPACAADERASPVSAEIDPATFLLRGYSAHVRLAPRSWPRWTVGVGVYALDLPAAMVDLVPANRAEDWQVRLRLGYGLFVDRLLWRRAGGQPDEGVLAGVQIAAQHFRVRNDRLGPESAKMVNWLLMPRIGYLLRPFAARFYLLGWLGLGGTGRISGDARVGADSYQVFPVIAFAAVHLGWSF